MTDLFSVKVLIQLSSILRFIVLLGYGLLNPLAYNYLKCITIVLIYIFRNMYECGIPWIHISRKVLRPSVWM